ncbi:hypothetical protein Vafri_18575 [Volvox africanus]|uniref:tRNA (guanine(46)-N(7))-methyltransferase n=1 Tax=Volvox africanus TaxID=51714 RepID=A0A8J4BLF5_9CHLO|nr:hypothetical protein Vafri_18575 [Volvox africanus]
MMTKYRIHAHNGRVKTFPSRRIGKYARRVLGGARDPARSLDVVRGSFTARPTWMTVKPADSRESPFHELDLMDLWDGTGKTRVRQHVNPLRRDYQEPTAAPDWAAVFSDPSLPLALDIGSGYGRFLLLLQRNNPNQQVNYLGMEIRNPLVDRANQWVDRLGLQGRVHYVFTNATVSLETLLGSYPGPITDVFIQFPDPHFKRRHHKRRVVQPQLVRALRDVMAPGGRLLLQSDVEEVCVAMRNVFERYASDAFALAMEHSQCAVFFGQPAGSSVPRGANTASLLSSTGPVNPLGPSGDLTAAAAAATEGLAGADTAAADAAALAISCELAASKAQRQFASPHFVRDPSVHSLDVTQHAVVAAVAVTHRAEDAAFDDDESSGDASTDEDGGASGIDGSSSGAMENDDADIGSMVSEWAKGGWLAENPIGTPTEREHYVVQQGLPVFRMLLVRT